MIDTGSTHSIIHIDTLHRLISRPSIRYTRKVHLTANNTELQTIGLVKLIIYMKNISTEVLAEVATELCAGLILGTDWIFGNGINIISTRKCIEKHQGSSMVIIPFSSYPRQLNANSSLTSMTLSSQPAQSISSLGFQCRVCYQDHLTKKQLFEHLDEYSHYATTDAEGITYKSPPEVIERINDLVEHISNVHIRQKSREILIRHGQLFDLSKATTINTVVKHTIETDNIRPIAQRPYRKSSTQEQIIADLCEQFHRDNIIRPSQSAWASPVVLQQKKDKSWRFCVDYRKLNEATKKDNYPLPRIQEIFDVLHGSCYFSKLDFVGGYHQVPIDENDKHKTAFITRDQLWEFNVMPQGIKNGPPTFQRIINKLLGNLQWKCALSYIDDVIIYSRSISEHLHHLEQVLSILSKANFRLNSNKCEFIRTRINFLGHVISNEGIEPSPEKTNAITQIQVPTSIKSTVSFAKMADYYRNFIPNFSEIAEPLFRLTKKDAKFVWDQEQQHSFEIIKNSLTSAPVLKFPDLQSPFTVQVDASNIGIGGVLMQNHGDGEQPIAYMSQKLNKQQQNWNATEKECFAVVSAIRKWNHYVAGQEFVVRTDHHALCWLNRKCNSNPKLNRWRMDLQQYTFTIEHVKGRQNCVPDCLSRYPVDSSCDYDDDNKSSKSTQTECQNEVVGAITTRRSSKSNQQVHQQSSQQRRNQSSQQLSNQSAQQQKQLSNQPTQQPEEQRSSNEHVSVQPVNEITVFTSEQLLSHQQQDPSIIKILENIQYKPFVDEYCLENSLLCRCVRRFNRIIKVPVVPKNKIKDILLAYHNTAINGSHLGKDKTFYKIRDRFYWQGMYNDIAQHIQACPNCTMNKQSRRKPNGHLNPVEPPAGVWENLAMDFVGPITPTSSSGHRYILVMTDLLSKFVVAKATRDNSALTAAKVLVEDVILKYGKPNQILTDNGRHFTAELFNSITSLCGICHVYTTPYNPQSNGTCERFNASMCASLASICNSRRTDWDQQLSKMVFSYNTSQHASTKLTPYEVVFGRIARLPFDLPQETTTITEPGTYLDTLKEHLQLAKQMVVENISRCQAKAKQRHDANRTNELYTVGDFVYIKQLGFVSKLNPKFIGPYQVIQQINSSIYRLQNPNNLREIFNVHINRLRRDHRITNSS